MSYDESETTSCMKFVAILYISGLRLAIHKKSDLLIRRATVEAANVLASAARINEVTPNERAGLKSA